MHTIVLATVASLALAGAAAAQTTDHQAQTAGQPDTGAAPGSAEATYRGPAGAEQAIRDRAIDAPSDEAQRGADRQRPNLDGKRPETATAGPAAAEQAIRDRANDTVLPSAAAATGDTARAPANGSSNPSGAASGVTVSDGHITGGVEAGRIESGAEARH